MTKTVVEILKEARELISVPERWCRYALALDAVGRRVSVRSHKAVCWCSIGALRRASIGASQRFPAARRLLENNVPLRYREVDIPDFNDRARHSTVLKAFDLAISKAEAGQ